MKLLSTLFLSLLILSIEVFSRKKATELPDISLIGNFVGPVSSEDKHFGVKEVELSFQHYLYPTVKANVFLGFHKEEEKLETSIEEAYLEFYDVYGLLTKRKTSASISGLVGKNY